MLIKGINKNVLFSFYKLGFFQYIYSIMHHVTSAQQMSTTSKLKASTLSIPDRRDNQNTCAPSHVLYFVKNHIFPKEHSKLSIWNKQEIQSMCTPHLLHNYTVRCKPILVFSKRVSLLINLQLAG